MKNVILIIYLVLFCSTFSIPIDMDKFIKLTPRYGMGLDIHRLMLKTAQCESDLIPHFKTTANIGMMQIQESTYEAMRKDMRMVRIISYNNLHYGTDISKYKYDTYANIVCAYTIYLWKITDVGDKWIPKFKPRLKGKNDKEWVYYKILYNSMEGKATYRRWKRKYKREMENE